MRDLVIGLDCSTTACKAVIWELTGRAAASGRAALPMSRPRPGWHEQPAESWWQAAAQALREAAGQVPHERLAALCIAPQRETFVPVGADGQPLGSALLWMDERCREQLPAVSRLHGKERFHQESGKPLSANLAAGKLLWLREHEPKRFERMERVLDVHAFLAQRLTGRCATAWGCADPLGLFDMRQHAWNRPLIEALGLRVEQFPETLPGGTVVGEITAQAARECGLPPGLLLVAGLGDGQAAGLGVCAVQPGEAYLNLGTAVVSGAFSERYAVDPAFRSMYSGIPGAYVFETVLLGGTYTINWFLENVSGAHPAVPVNQILAHYEALAAQIPPGALGLTLVPYWNSAMNPYWDASASGIVVGWRGVHQAQHFYRAVLEGIAMEQRLHTEGVEAALGSRVDRYIAVGGGARSPLWRQIIADVTGKAVYRAEPEDPSAPDVEATALGAGILAAAGVGLFPSTLEAARSMARVSAVPCAPDPARHDFYTRLFEEVYRRLYPSLQDSLRSLADLTANL